MAPPLLRNRGRIAAVTAVTVVLLYRTGQLVGTEVAATGSLDRQLSSPAYEGLDVDYGAPAAPIVVVDEFALPAALVVGAATAGNSTKNVTLAADVFLVDGCVKFVSVVTCDFPRVNFSFVEVEVTAVYDDSVCADGAPCTGVQPTAGKLARRPPTRVLHRDGWNWEPVTVAELCAPQLARGTAARPSRTR